MTKGLRVSYEKRQLLLKRIEQLPETFFAWFTGFWEARGRITFLELKNSVGFIFAIYRNEKYNGEEVLEKIKGHLGGNVYSQRTRSQREKVMYQWASLTGEILPAIIKRMLPYMMSTQRKKQIQKLCEEYEKHRLKICEICGEKFWAYGKSQWTCGEPECRKERHRFTNWLKNQQSKKGWKRWYEKKENKERHREVARKSAKKRYWEKNKDEKI